MPVIDTHEHLMWDEDERNAQTHDVFVEYLKCYMDSDLISAGLNRADFERVAKAPGDIMEKWRTVEPYWEAARHTGYTRSLDISVKLIYGIDGINRDTIEAVNAAFLAGRKPEHYLRVLRELCNIETGIINVGGSCVDFDSPFFKYAWDPPYICTASNHGQKFLSWIEERLSVSIRGLDDWQDALEKDMDRVFGVHGVFILKSWMAYWRPLRFEKTPYHEAKALFADILEQWRRQDAPGEGIGFSRELSDYMMHYLLGLASKRNVTYQIHTGYQAGYGNYLPNGDCPLLNNLFIEYPDVGFHLFHMSYPHPNAACALAKMFPNVTLDMGRAHIICPSACVTALDDFLDAVPHNKITAFGGDYLFVDGVPGHLQITRENVARTLAGKVERGVFDEGKAIDIARALFYDNPKRIFRL